MCAVAAIALLVAGAPWVLHHVFGENAGATVAGTPVLPGGSSPTRSIPRPTIPRPTPTPSVPADFATAFKQLSDGIGAQIGFAYAPVGNPQQVATLGKWSTGPAWSTIKVPLSLALLRQDRTQNVTDSMRSAITASDNDAAEQVWEALGAHQTAATKVESVLADAGPPIPVVQSEVTRAGFSAFGQTQWSLSDQARFLAHAACDPRDQPVLALMGDVVPSQRWGLGTFDDARFKGGWGPGLDGSYLVRQYGLVTAGGGQSAVAIAAVADSGGFGDGTAVLNRMAAWLQNHLDSLTGGRCPNG